MMRLSGFLGIVACLAGTGGRLDAQFPRPDSGVRLESGAAGVWAGVAHSSTIGMFGRAVGRDVALVGVRWTHPGRYSESYSLEYVADLIPAAWVSVPPPADLSGGGPSCAPNSRCLLQGTFAGQRAVYGVGVMPAGFQLRLRPRARFQPFVAGGGGLILFREPVPDVEAGRLNFVGELGGGAVATLGRRTGVLLGYKFHHLSNGGTRPSNPGIDSHLIYLGLLRFRATN